MKVSRISKIAGLSFAGFVVATLAVDKMNVGPVVSQLAGIAGAVAGTLMGRIRGRQKEKNSVADAVQAPQIDPPGASDSHL